MKNRSDRLAGHPVYFQTLSQLVSLLNIIISTLLCILYLYFHMSRCVSISSNCSNGFVKIRNLFAKDNDKDKDKDKG